MALKWIIGNSITGAISEADTLPVIRKGDLLNLDVNAGDSTTITVSRADLPSDWRTYLKPFDRFVALVDDEVTFASGVIAAGLINKIDGNVKDVVMIQVALGAREWMAARGITTVYNTTDVNPASGVTFTASTWQGVQKAIIQHCFSSTGMTGGIVPLGLLGNVDGTVTGTTYSLTVKNSDFMTYAEALDKVRDTLSPGNEYKFVPRWFSSVKNKIVMDVVIGTDAAPHIGEATTRAIQLADNTWKPLKFGQSASSDNLVSRIIGQSKFGSGTTGSDFTTKTSTAGTTIAIDQFFNPGTELTTAEMSAQLTARLGYNSTLQKEARFERSYDTLTDLRTMISYLGNMATFTGTAEAAQFGATMRIVGLSFSPERKVITVSLIPKAARYPKLPKDRKNDLGSDGGYDNTGTSTPVAPPAYTPPVVPPFTLPGDTHTEAESILTPVDMRHFSQYTENGVSAWDGFHKYPDVTRSRFNYATGEMIGLATASRQLYGMGVGYPYVDSWDSSTVWKAPTNYNPHNKDLDIYSVDIPGMFDRDSNPYMDTKWSTAPNADSFKKRVGTIPYSLYAELEINPDTFRASLPASNYNRNRAMAIADYNLFCTQDLQTVYVQIMVTTSISQIDNIDAAGGYKSYSTTLSKVFKGVRDGAGVITTWEDLGDTLVLDKDLSSERTFFSTAIYEIDGQFHAFGGYLIPLVEDRVKAPTLLPAYELKFYQHGHTMVNVTNFVYNMEEIDLPGITALDTKSVNETVELKAKFPYAINVDYSQNKISLGISRGADGKLSQYFSSSFSNLLNFTKILTTDREQAITNAGANSDHTGTAVEPFRFRSKAPIFYKNNFFLFNGSSTSVNQSSETSAKNYTNKQINHIRGKVGFTDTVAGALKLNTLPTNNTNSPAKDAYFIYNSTASRANDLGAFGNYNYRALNVPYETRDVLGMEYFIYQGFLYIICDTSFTEYENGGSPLDLKFRYWIGKFRVRDEVL